MFLLPWITFATPVAAATPSACLDAPRTELVADGGFDTIRVTTADGAPGAASVVAVASGDRFTSLTARAGGVSAVALDVGGDGPVTIALEPDLEAATAACVQRIELWRAGAVVARLDVATPRASW